jgi:hypothetical protein
MKNSIIRNYNKAFQILIKANNQRITNTKTGVMNLAALYGRLATKVYNFKLSAFNSLKSNPTPFNASPTPKDPPL